MEHSSRGNSKPDGPSSSGDCGKEKGDEEAERVWGRALGFQPCPHPRLKVSAVGATRQGLPHTGPGAHFWGWPGGRGRTLT